MLPNHCGRSQTIGRFLDLLRLLSSSSAGFRCCVGLGTSVIGRSVPLIGSLDFLLVPFLRQTCSCPVVLVWGVHGNTAKLRVGWLSLVFHASHSVDAKFALDAFFPELKREVIVTRARLAKNQWARWADDAFCHQYVWIFLVIFYLTVRQASSCWNSQNPELRAASRFAIAIQVACKDCGWHNFTILPGEAQVWLVDPHTSESSRCLGTWLMSDIVSKFLGRQHKIDRDIKADVRIRFDKKTLYLALQLVERNTIPVFSIICCLENRCSLV